jgi:hypothetical protein
MKIFFMRLKLLKTAIYHRKKAAGMTNQTQKMPVINSKPLPIATRLPEISPTVVIIRISAANTAPALGDSHKSDVRNDPRVQSFLDWNISTPSEEHPKGKPR